MTADAISEAKVAAERIGAKPVAGLILGSGLGEQIADVTTISYKELPGSPVPSIEGHAGNLLIGTLGSATVAYLQGRAHSYEGDLKAMVTPVRTLKLIGCAAGALVAELGVLEGDGKDVRTINFEDMAEVKAKKAGTEKAIKGWIKKKGG